MMTTDPILDATSWPQQTFGSVELGDKRRVARAVELGVALLQNPAASLPRQLGSKAALTASYQLLHEPDVTHAAVLRPHFEQTRATAGTHPLVLLSADTSLLDYSHHRKTKALGPIGNGKGRGYLVHSVLALLPEPPLRSLGSALRRVGRRSGGAGRSWRSASCSSLSTSRRWPRTTRSPDRSTSGANDWHHPGLAG